MSKITSGIWRSLTRKKYVDVDKLEESQLKRCLTFVDLTALGIGGSLGAGMYILLGSVARNLSGPSIVFSFLIAALASLFSGMCYAEFAARVPKAGSAYMYSYVSVGEFWAFVIGWNMILENIIGVAASGKAWSQFVDSIFNDTISRTLEKHARLASGDDSWMDSHPDILALMFVILVLILTTAGVKLSSRINVVFSFINMLMIIIIIAVGLPHCTLSNWTRSPHGFFPFGFRGVLAGAAACFYSFIGFDNIATSGEESVNPTKHVPIAIITTLTVCLLCYLGVGSVLTLLVPWNTLSHTAALPKAFAQQGITFAEYAIAVGGVCGLIASTFVQIYPLPRSIYSMAQDGLLFKWLGTVCKKTQIPLAASIVSGLLVAVTALLLDLDSLIEMMSIGTLMAYTLVAISVLVLRYQKNNVGLTASQNFPPAISIETTSIISNISDKSFNTNNNSNINKTSNNDSNSNNQSNNKNNLQTLSSNFKRHSIASLFSSASSLPHSTRLFSHIDTSITAMGEDTGLLRVGGEKGNKVRYVPTKTTTVVRKLKPKSDNEDSDGDDSSDVITPAITITQKPSVVEEYRQRIKQQQPESSTIPQLDQPESKKKGSYERMEQSSLSLQPLDEPTEKTRQNVIVCTVVMVVVWVVFCALSIHGPGMLPTPLNTTQSFKQPGKMAVEVGEEDVKNIRQTNIPKMSFNWYIGVTYVVLLLVLMGLVAVIWRQPKNNTPLIFTTPMIPLLPIFSILINIYLMFTLSDLTWIRFTIWISIGFVVYFSYGMWHSLERRDENQQIILKDEQQQ